MSLYSNTSPKTSCDMYRDTCRMKMIECKHLLCYQPTKNSLNHKQRAIKKWVVSILSVIKKITNVNVFKHHNVANFFYI
jgi:hypothetical protein